VAAQLSKLAALNLQTGAGDVATALATYTELFTSLFYVGLGVAAVQFLLAPLLKKMMHGIH